MKIATRIINLFLKNTNVSCDEIKLQAFIDCINNNKFKSLKRYRFIPVPSYILEYAWTILFEEYCEISKNPGYETFYSSLQKIYRLDSKILAISSAVKALSIGYNKDCIEVLKSFGYCYKFDHSNRRELIRDLNRVVSKSKTIIAEREKEKASFEKMKKNKVVESSGMEYFSISLITLSKYMGYRLDPKIITVREFCDMTTGYEKEIEHLMQKK